MNNLFRPRRIGWFSKETLCELFDCNPTYFETTLRRKIPEEAIDKGDRAFTYNGRTVIEVWAESRLRVSRKVKGDVVEPALGDLDTVAVSPALEKFRTERYKLARMERLQKQNLLIPRDKVRSSLLFLASILRDATDRLQKLYGSRVVELMDEALQVFEAQIEDLCSKTPKRK